MKTSEVLTDEERFELAIAFEELKKSEKKLRRLEKKYGLDTKIRLDQKLGVDY